MAPDRDDEPAGGPETDDWEEPPRSIFSTTWFRAVIVVLVVGAVAAVSIPYVMDAVSPPRATAPPPTASAPAPAPTPPPPVAAAPTPPPAPPSSPVATAVTKPAELPKPAAKSDAPKAAAPKADAPAPKAAAPKADTKAETAKAPAPKAAKAVAQAPKTDAAPAPKADAPPKRVAKATAPAERGEFWVQVGAFRDAEAAKRLADGLRGKGFQVAESKAGTTAPASAPVSDAGDRYDVIVSGGAPGDVTKKLTAKGLSAEERRDGAVVRPSLPLRDAVTLSNDLRGEGLTVTVRRAVAPGAAPATTTATAAAGSDGLHRVRVGAFTDRAAARAAVEKLQALGHTPFIAKGRE